MTSNRYLKSHAEMEYFDRKGNITQDPLPSIRAANMRHTLTTKFHLALEDLYAKLSTAAYREENFRLTEDLKQQLQRYPNRDEIVDEYFAHDPTTETWTIESWNECNDQADRFVSGVIPGRMTAHDVQKSSEDAIALLQRIIDDKQLKSLSGSTVSLLINLENEIIQVNLGDSVAYMYAIHESGNQFVQLNENHIHQPEKELERLKKTSGIVKKGRLYSENNKHLGVSRALGDKTFEKYGLTHVPETTIKRITHQGKMILINACDGLTEQLTNKAIENILQKHADQHPQKIAEALLEAAKGAGAKDNITISVKIYDPKQPSYSAIFDGHGTDEVADIAARCFPFVFENQLLMLQLAKEDGKLAEIISANLLTAIENQPLDSIREILVILNIALQEKLEDKQYNINPALNYLALQALAASVASLQNGLHDDLKPMHAHIQKLVDRIKKLDASAVMLDEEKMRSLKHEAQSLFINYKEMAQAFTIIRTLINNSEKFNQPFITSSLKDYYQRNISHLNNTPPEKVYQNLIEGLRHIQFHSALVKEKKFSISSALVKFGLKTEPTGANLNELITEALVALNDLNKTYEHKPRV